MIRAHRAPDSLTFRTVARGKLVCNQKPYSEMGRMSPGQAEALRKRVFFQGSLPTKQRVEEIPVVDLNWSTIYINCRKCGHTTYSYVIGLNSCNHCGAKFRVVDRRR